MNLDYRILGEHPLADDRHQHVLNDEEIELTGPQTRKHYSDILRRVAVWNSENEQVIELIINQRTWTVNTIGELHKARWQIEIFFREIKQLLHIKSFVGSFHNAVMIQI